MDEVYYKPLIEDMVWSFSRLTSFESCPHQWFLKYIRGAKDRGKFYANYGSFMHKILERYYKGELKRSELVSEFLCGFSDNVIGKRPPQSTVNNYIDCGVEYLENFEDFDCETVAVEQNVEFEIEGKKFTGYIDYIGFKDGEYYIIDHKSSKIKMSSRRSKHTTTYSDFDKKLRQLYLYSVYIKREFGAYPKWLCFNCFRTNTFIKVPFDIDAFNATIEWALGLIEEIENTTDFYNPTINYFYCNWICGVNDHCDYYDFYFNNRGR